MFLIEVKLNSMLDEFFCLSSCMPVANEPLFGTVCGPYRLASTWTESQDCQNPRGILLLGHVGQ